MPLCGGIVAPALSRENRIFGQRSPEKTNGSALMAPVVSGKALDSPELPHRSSKGKRRPNRQCPPCRVYQNGTLIAFGEVGSNDVPSESMN